MADSIESNERTKESTLSRRDFTKLCAALALSSALSSACAPSPTPTSTLTATSTATPSSTPTAPPTLTPTALPSPTPTTTPAEGEITVEMIAAAEKIFGLELTDKERDEIIQGLTEHRDEYLLLRELEMDDTVVPSMVFNPIPPGMTFERDKKPFRYSNVQVQTPENIEDVAFYSVLQLAKLIQTRQITSLELTKMYLARLKRYNPTLLFVVNLTEELAIEQARKADEEIQAGNCRGPLHGIPYGIKDLFSVKGYPTTWGAEPFINRIIDRDASVVEKLEQAGAVLVAKLATGRLASGDQWFRGMTRNPWNPEWNAGGSSAGPGSATAAGCVGFSVGTESAGSMISPCDACGVSGLRPTFGRVSRYGVMTTGWSWDKVAPMCRTVEDCAVVFNAIYGPDGRDNTIIDLPFNWDPDFDIRNLRIGYRRKFFEGELMDGDPVFRRAVRAESLKVLDLFRESGFDLKPLDFDHLLHPYSRSVGCMMMAENGAANDSRFRGDQMEWFNQLDSSWPRYWKESRFIPAVEYLQASRCRSLVIAEMAQVMKDIDVYIEITWTSQWDTNMSGHPMVVVPCGFLSQGRPASISFVGQLFGEAELLAVAKWYQDTTGFHLLHPEL
jgi:Asp-tRNA(Asn)/Glu-tRNA(Gln) amidotransferase A subunit family amidase